MKNKANIEFMSLLEKFLTDYLPFSLNAGSNTVKSYKCAFRLLFQYLKEEAGIELGKINFEVLNFELLLGFCNWLEISRGNSRTTVKQRMGALASFAEYAQNRNFEAGYIFRSSLRKVSSKTFRKVKSKQRCTFTREELEIFFSLPDTSDKIGWRNFVILVVMYASGARAQEICNLSVKDVTYDNDQKAVLKLLGKGDKSRRVKITADATKILNKYIAYKKIENQPYCHIFSSQRNEQISVSCIEEIFSKYEKIAKQLHPDKFCMGRYTPHVMRHTTATHLIEAGVPIAVVKNILGHSSIQTTQIYIEITQQTIDKSIKNWNEKWFQKDSMNEEQLPKIQDCIPDFLR